MKDKDLYNLVSAVNCIAPEVLDADNTPAAIDLQGCAGALVSIHIGAGGITFSDTNKVEFKLTHSDDNSSYAAVTVNDVVGLSSVGTGGIIKSLTAEHATATLTKVGYKGGKRYLKVLADFSGTHGTGTPMAVSVIKGGVDILPVS
ncbi:hypothetical protein [uncultured Desulfobacter sp.]|uniref:hypothetical protein n=1 Tax=uncultured Desulfobacter sp. TaxID=240139 RepID=UPI0029C73077|nr:hypothetical protein [uncultured Desulfobacter sp.]